MVKEAVFRIQDILVWIRIHGSITWLMDQDPDSDPDTTIFIIDLQDANKKLILKKFFLIITFWRYIYIIFQR